MSIAEHPYARADELLYADRSYYLDTRRQYIESVGCNLLAYVNIDASGVQRPWFVCAQQEGLGKSAVESSPLF